MIAQAPPVAGPDHLLEPDFTRPLLVIPPPRRAALLELLTRLYGRAKAETTYPEVERLLRVHYAHKTAACIDRDRQFDPTNRFTERDVVLITYGDLLIAPGELPLRTLARFLDTYVRDSFTIVHLLPFFPYSSDRGFAIIDYEEVEPELGTWGDVYELERSFKLMFDGVFNHASSKSGWFQRFLNGEPGYRDFFVAFSTREALSPDYLRLILRPRTSDLLTLFHGLEGPRYVWTTFGPDQVDLNFRNERVLLRIVEILLLYVRRGASLIRLDAITYVWRSLGTSCALLEETHVLVQLFRTILDIVSPRVALITETNVPHEENVRYLGDGINEAQLVYNFALPPLVLHTFQTGSSRRLTEWARSLPFVSRHATYFNFLASHDGIGLLGARGILTDQEIDDMVRRTEMNGGLVSYRSNGDGSSSPYELNVTWWSALNPEGTADSHETQVARLLAARAVALSLMGVPGVYFPTLFGAKNDLEAVTAGAEKRAINRKTIDEPTLRAQLADAGSHSSIVARGFTRLLRTRISQPAFHPNARQHVLDLGDHVFGVLRQPETGPPLLAVINVTDRPLMRELRPGRVTTRGRWRDALSERTYPADPEGRLDVELKPYGVRWLIPD